MTKTLKVGMIGYKFMGKTHSNAWRQVDKFFPVSAQPVLHTICGRDKKGVTAAAKQLGWNNVSTRWQDVVANPEIDILDINTANDTHAEIAKPVLGRQAVEPVQIVWNIDPQLGPLKNAQSQQPFRQTQRLFPMIVSPSEPILELRAPLRDHDCGFSDVGSVRDHLRRRRRVVLTIGGYRENRKPNRN